MRTVLLVVLALGASTAFADPRLPSAGRFKAGKVENSSVAFDDRAEGKKIFWTFDVRTSSAMGIELTVPLTIPTTASVTSMRVKLGDQEELFAESVAAADARTRYEIIVSRATDPALLEHVADDQLRLRVFPVSQSSPATITIELFVPGETRGA